MRLLAILVSACVFATTSFAADPTQYGQFKVALDADNGSLPTSITWTKGDVELIDPKMGLNHSFTDFEYRNKFYRDENRNAWPGKDEPRFATDIQVKGSRPVDEGGFAGVAVSFTDSYAAVERRLLFHKDEPRFRVEYRFEAARDMMIHEPESFSVALQFAPGFTQETVADARKDGATLTAAGLKRTGYTLSLLNGGPSVLTNPDKHVSLLVSGSVSGDLPSPIPTRQVRIKKGAKFAFTLDVEIIADETAAVRKAVESAQALGPTAKPFILVSDARLLMQQKKFDEAEAALLKAAELNKEYATPYSILAGLRRDTKAAGASQTEAWIEGAYRQPYNYGLILSGSGFWKDKRLTEAERRQFIFDTLICVENTVFYPDYYIWAARSFEEMKMYAQTCAMYRQALWAADRMPRLEAEKEKFRATCRKKIAELEAKMTQEISPELPDLIPVRPAK